MASVRLSLQGKDFIVSRKRAAVVISSFILYLVNIILIHCLFNPLE